MANEKILGAVGVFIVIFILIVAFFVSSFTNSNTNQEELNFSVTGSNECLRFLSRKIETAYIPFKTGSNEQWELTIECTAIANEKGWVDLYLYEGYWDKGDGKKCFSEDLYSILDDIVSLDYKLGLENPYVQYFGTQSPESYTLLFIFPPGESNTFAISLKQIG